MIGEESGFAFERYDDMHGQWRIIEVNGGGVAVSDFDRDGLLDLFLTNGCRLPLKPDDRATPSQLFRNRGEMRFERTTRKSLLEQFGYATGCAVGDYDGDGFDDLYVCAFGENSLWHNEGDGTFTEATPHSNTEVPAWSSSAAFADLNRDGLLDLYVVNYLIESDESPKLCPEPASPTGFVSCSPAIFSGADDVLFLSEGDGRFADVTSEAGIAGLQGKGLGVAVSDFDADGRPEIYVANDGQPNLLLVNAAENEPSAALLRFEDRALSCGVALSENGYAQAGMGVAIGDYDASGTSDIFLTHFFGDTNTLYSNRGNLLFEDLTRASKLGPPSRTFLGFGTAFFDPDNDGWLDLIVANGHVDDRTFLAHGEPYKMPPQMFRNGRDGTFRDVSAWAGGYFRQEWLGRGLAVGDLNRDGRMDVVVSHQRAPSVILENETAADRPALVLRLVGTTSNRNGYGVRLETVDAEPTIVRELIGGGSFQSGSAPELHVACTSAEPLLLKVSWPSGLVQQHRFAPGNWLLVEGSKPVVLAGPHRDPLPK